MGTYHWYALLLLIVVLIAAFAKHKPLASLAAFVSYGFISLILITELLSHPKPLQNELFGEDKAIVLSYVAQEDVAIYLWLMLNGETEPRYYVMPWSDEAAQELHEAQQQAEADGTGVEMNMQNGTDLRYEDGIFESLPVAPPVVKS